jgi:prophage regulatory protein
MANVRKLVSRKELRTIYGIPLSFTQIERKEKAGTFPLHLKCGDHRNSRVAWYADEIEAWIDEQPRPNSPRSIALPMGL